MKIAILGANGFVGSRLTESFHLGGVADVRPVVRSFSSLAGLARFDLPWAIADALTPDGLHGAIEGCEALISAIQGPPVEIIRTAVNCYRAAASAGVKRLVYISSASVHGLAPKAGTDETSALPLKSRYPYNDAKARAELELMRLREGGGVELVILRPGIIYGPRSPRWTAGIAQELLEGRASLINHGSGICNAIYVDNLVEAIRLCLSGEGDGEAFCVGDREVLTWLDLYRPIANALGFDANSIPEPGSITPQFVPSFKDRMKELHASNGVQRLLPFIPLRIKRVATAAIAKPQRRVFPSPWKIDRQPPIRMSEEMAELQSCNYKLPIKKARTVIHYEPVISYHEACARNAAWLKFAGFPVV